MGTALITGASSGLGLEFAWQLATAKHDLVLVARDQGRLEHVAEQVRQVAGVAVEVLVADLAVAEERARVAERLRVGTLEDDAPGGPGAPTVQNEHGRPHPRGLHPASRAFQVPAAGSLAPVGLLVNNAGFGLGQPFVRGDLTRERDALAVMVTAVLELSHAAVAQMTSRGRGVVLNVSSVAALLASGTYSAHKAWVRTFTEGLAAELSGTGVSATVVAPGLTHTEFHERAALAGDDVPALAWLDAAHVVRQALDGARLGRTVVTPSWRYQLVSGVVRLLPRSVVRVLGSPGLRVRD